MEQSKSYRPMIDKNALQGGLKPCSVFFHAMIWLNSPGENKDNGTQNGMGER